MIADGILQDEALLVSWKQHLERDAETLKLKANLNNLRTVRETFSHKRTIILFSSFSFYPYMPTFLNTPSLRMIIL